MKKVDQIVIGKNGNTLGDCFRACLASIFEFDIKSMPNFWEETQDAKIYWKLTNEWLAENYDYKCIVVKISNDEMDVFVKDVLCIAIADSIRGAEHAVVWYNEMIHDPHPDRSGILNKPECFTFLISTGLKN